MEQDLSSALANMFSTTAQTCLQILFQLLPILAPVLGAYLIIPLVIRLLGLVFADPELTIRGAFIDHIDDVDFYDPETGEYIDWEELENEEGSWSWDDEDED